MRPLLFNEFKVLAYNLSHRFPTSLDTLIYILSLVVRPLDIVNISNPYNFTLR